MASVNVALFQIVQLYDKDWQQDLIDFGYHDEAKALAEFIAGREIADSMALRLRDIMAGAMMERDCRE